jgi:Mce-associated membrane protein
MTSAEATTQADDSPAPIATASWAARAAAFAVDILPGAVVAATTALVALSVPLRAGWWWACVAAGAVAILWTASNRILLPSITGTSLGRAVFGISVVHKNGAAVGPAWLLLRDLAHLLDTAPAFAGWLWPLRDSRRRTFADTLMRTESRSIAARSTDLAVRRLVAPVMLTAAALCAVGAAVSYTVVRQQEQAVADTSTQIAAQGPRLVVQILSYHPETLQGDFEHARSLTTDKYRVELSALQQAALKSGPLPNEYWVTRSSVLDATPGHATMLLFVQGQRGVSPNLRDIAASLRVTFVKSDRAGWRVDDVAVVTEPQVAEAKS